jgi:starch phosphorylase
MEFMLSEALPIYSGGLGNVAGDQLKAASDLGVPVVAVGLLYSQGYFRQVIDDDGAQRAVFPFVPLRPNLLLHDPERLLRLLNDPVRPMQLVLAGKAHPADAAGQALIREWSHFIARHEARHRVVFLSDYDMLLCGPVVQGIDVWLNTPRRPWEASGTSGMKVLVNGGLNLSELDGWWAEAYAPDIGWALGDGNEHGDDPAWDAVEADALYELLEREVIPQFHDRDEHGIPRAWVARMRESMARLTPRFSTNRTVREYVERHYLPAAAAYRERAGGGGAQGARIVSWRHMLDDAWPALRFGEMKVESDGESHVFDVQVDLGELDPEAVGLELYAEGVDSTGPTAVTMMRLRREQNPAKWYVYSAQVPAARPLPTTPRGWYRVSRTLACLWSAPASCGNVDAVRR